MEDTPLQNATVDLLRPGGDSASHLSDSDLTRAVRHHRRAITALTGPGFARLSESVVQRILHRTKANLAHFEEELARRALET